MMPKDPYAHRLPDYPCPHYCIQSPLQRATQIRVYPHASTAQMFDEQRTYRAGRLSADERRRYPQQHGKPRAEGALPPLPAPSSSVLRLLAPAPSLQAPSSSSLVGSHNHALSRFHGFARASGSMLQVANALKTTGLCSHILCMTTRRTPADKLRPTISELL